ncbi:MAG: glycosyltransferase family 39 protein [Holosporaceae bacterium]|jgi:hypothetical protein|nr:glycosyltransferase family 39 protein [Holosporaceae bacterium]
MEKSEKYFFMLALALLGGFVVTYGYYLIHGACLIFGDESLQFACFLEQKKIPILRGGAQRFSPLMSQEFQLYVSSSLGNDTKIILIKVHLFIEMLFFITFIWLGMRKLSINRVVILLTCFLALAATPELFYFWGRLEILETTIVVLWALWFFCFVSAHNSDKSNYYALAVISATVAIYMKETAFILFLPSTLLILAVNFQKLSSRAKTYHIMIVVQVIIFFAAYYRSIRHHTEPRYGNWITADRLEVIYFYLRNFPIAAICNVVLITRSAYFLINRQINVNVADMLSLNSLLFVCAYVILRMGIGAPYYFLPANVVSCIALSVYLHEFRKSKLIRKLYNQTGVNIIVCCIFLNVPSFIKISEISKIQKSYQDTKTLLEELLKLKKSGYVFVTYMPRIECLDERSFAFYYWGVAETLSRLIAFYSNEFSPKATFIGRKKFEYVPWCAYAQDLPYIIIRNDMDISRDQLSNKFLIFDDPLLLGKTLLQHKKIIYLYREIYVEIPNLNSSKKPFKELPFNTKLYLHETNEELIVS